MRHTILLISGILSLMFWACSPTRTLSDDQYLLVKNKVEVKGAVNSGDAYSYIRQEPNTKTLGVYRLYLQLYLQKKNEDGKLSAWLDRVGEEPVVYDSIQAGTSADQIEQYFKSRGYFYASCTYEAKRGFFRRKQTRTVTYTIAPGPGYSIRNIDLKVESKPLKPIREEIMENTLLKPGDPYDAEVLNDERQRIQTKLKEKGYFFFSKEFVYFNIDTTVGTHQADVVVRIQNRKIQNRDTAFSVDHRPYKISEIYIEADYRPRGQASPPTDTIAYGMYRILYRDSLKIEPRALVEAVRFSPDEWYNTYRVDQTYNHFSSLRSFRTINIRFQEDTSSTETLLIARIQLSPLQRRSIGVETELTHEVGNFGINGRVIYRDRNVFGGLEQFDISVRGAIETQNSFISENTQLFNSTEMGIESNLRIPRFLLPFETEDLFPKRFQPFTNIHLGYRREVRQEFTRSASSGSFGYIWNENAAKTHIFNPINITSVSLNEEANITLSANPFLANAFRNQLITALNYSFIFNNQNYRRRTTPNFYHFFRGNFELSGTALHGFRNTFELNQNSSGKYLIAGLPYSHYIKGDADYRAYFDVGERQQVALRGFAGWAHVFKNSDVLPLDKQYFAGGSTDNRAFTAYRLGPGSFESDSVQFNTGDIKLGVFAEYRFPIIGDFLGAVFIDAGNIWTGNREEAPVESRFDLDSFYQQMALGTGFGIRYDFNFFIIRLDLAVPLHDPGKDIPWRVRELGFNDVKLNIGLGYPF